MTLDAKPAGLFTRDFNIDAQGQRIARLDVSHWREASSFSIAGQSYKLFREGIMSGAFILESAGQPVARAVKPSAFVSEFDLEVNSLPFTLKRDSIFGKSFSVFQNEVFLGRIHRAGLFTRKTEIELPADWPVPIQVFVFWLVLLMWNRADGSSAGAVAAAGS